MIPEYHGSIAAKKLLLGSVTERSPGWVCAVIVAGSQGVAVFSVAARGPERYGMKGQHGKRSSIIGTASVAP